MSFNKANCVYLVHAVEYFFGVVFYAELPGSQKNQLESIG